MCKNILLVQPQWPIPSRKKDSVHHKYFPTGLLKMSTLFKSQGHNVEFIIGTKRPQKQPDEIYCTSLFTYWAHYVLKTVSYYRAMFPAARIIVGGPYISLMSHFDPLYIDLIKSFNGIDECFIGLYHEAENCLPDLSLVPDSDVMTLNSSRGCIRACKPCGVSVLESSFTWKESIQREILRNKIIFYDNNFLANPAVSQIFEETASTKVNGRVVVCESQAGFDARILVQKPHLAKLIKKARFQRPRVAFDNSLDEYSVVEEAVRLLREAGYSMKEIMVFIIYNYEQDFSVVEAKRKMIGSLGAQVSDCRYRPLDLLEDNYKPGKPQLPGEYYINPNWTDAQVKEFRRLVRGQNIMVRFLSKNRKFEENSYWKIFKKYNVPDKVLKEFHPHMVEPPNRISDRMVS